MRKSQIPNSVTLKVVLYCIKSNVCGKWIDYHVHRGGLTSSHSSKDSIDTEVAIPKLLLRAGFEIDKVVNEKQEAMAFTSVPTIGTRSFTPPMQCNRRAVSPNGNAGVKMILGKSVQESIEANPNYSTLRKLADAAGVDLNVSNCTVFAPGNRAFAQLREGLVEELLADPTSARAIILRHIVPGVQTSKQIKGSGFYDGVPGGPLPYEAVLASIKIAGQPLVAGYENDECDNGIIHTLGGVILDAPTYSPPSVSQYYEPSIPKMDEKDSIVAAVFPSPVPGFFHKRALGAASSPSTVGGRKAMGLMSQQPFWKYGPPYNASKQEDFEPISIAQPGCASVDYQVMPPGSVVVDPKEVNASELLPVSGMSKYIGTAKRMVEGDGLSDYSRLDE